MIGPLSRIAPRTCQRQRPVRRLLLVGLALAPACFSLGCSTLPTSKLTSKLTGRPHVDAQALAESQASVAIRAGQAEEAAGRPDAAIRCYEQALAFRPQDETAVRRLAVLYDRRGDDERALLAYEQALKLNPENSELLNDRGVFHADRGQWQEAETWFRKALERQPADQRARVNLAKCMVMQGRWDEGFQTYEIAVGPAAAHSNLGVLLIEQGRWWEAQQHLQTALTIDPTIRPAQELLAGLERSGMPSRAVAETGSPNWPNTRR